MSVRRVIPFAFFLATLLAISAGATDEPAGATAEEEATFSEEITVTAIGEPVSTADVPLPVTVISRSEIDDAQADTVGDMLRRVPGVVVMQSGGPGALTSVFTRGNNSNSTLVMIDGVRLNSPYFGGYDFSHLVTSGLDRIEVARGPYSALWGADAVGGVVNLITGRGRNGFHGTAFGEVGAGSGQRLDASMTYGHERFDLYASASTRSGDTDLNNSDFDIRQAVVDAGWSWTEGGRVGLVYHDVDSDLGIPYSSPGQATPSRRETNKQRTLAIPFQWQLSEKWKIEATGSLVERDFNFSDPDDPFGLTTSHTVADTSQVRLASHHGIAHHTITWGAEWREDSVTASSSFGTNLDDATGRTESLFVQDVWGLGDRTDLIIGARWDHTDEWGSQLSPRAHIGWGLSDVIALTVGYGEAFREPSLGELYFPGSGNQDLRPETSGSAEIGLSFQAKGPRGPSWQLNAFRTEIDNLIFFDFASYTMQNVGKATINGVEAGLAVPHTENLQSSIDLTWLDTSDGSGDQLLRRPEWSGAYTLHGRAFDRLRGDFTVQYVGARQDVDPTSFATVTAESFVTANLALACQAWRMIEVTVRATNLLDRDYAEVYGYPAPGRRFAAGFRVAW